MQKSVQDFFNSPDFAANYETKTRKSNWAGPEILFGLAFRNIRAEEKLLDLGTGTGLCGELFFRAGLRVYGLDASREMLSVAAAKKFAVELREHDLSQTPWPYDDGVMDHAVCGGVLHIFADPTPIFRETARILRPGGTFAFSCLEKGEDSLEPSIEHQGHQIHYHDFPAIKRQLAECGFLLVKALQFSTEAHDRMYHFRACVVEKKSGREEVEP